MALDKHFINEQKARLLEQLSIAEQAIDPNQREEADFLEGKIARLKIALWRIREAQYGLCTNCGCLIEQETLQSFPEAIKCLTCYQEDSRTSKFLS